MTQAFPLQWPAGRPRTRHPVAAKFNTRQVPNGRSHTVMKALTVADALGRLQSELDRLKARNYVLSSNVALRLDGMPRSGTGEPEDRGVALYFTIDGNPHCMPCDRYDRVADNIAAIAKHIEATRAIARYGVASMKEMFAGFVALPSPEDTHRKWWNVLDVNRECSLAEINVAYRAKAKRFASDEAALKILNIARDEGVKEVS